MIGILNYGMGNIGSIFNILRYVGCKSIIVEKSDDLKNIDKLILPGVGHFGEAMKKINEIPELVETLNFLAKDRKIPILGICLGMQLLTDFSEEGNVPGLSWIRGKTYKFPILQNLKIPHMGWNTIKQKIDIPLTSEIGYEDRYYFVHSYYVKVLDKASSMMTTNYGIDFDSGIINKEENIFGVQFHPEKSHKFGIKIFKNFIKI